MASYWDLFGSPPILSRHAALRFQQRGITAADLHRALSTAGVPGAAPDTLVFATAGCTVIVDALEGIVITGY